MDAGFWHERWQRKEIGFHQEEVHPFLARFFSALKLPRGARVLVPFCGKSLDMLWLCEQGFAVTGVELSRLAIDEFFAENRLQPQISQQGAFLCYQLDQLTIYCGDFFALSAEQLGAVAAGYDRGSLVALPASMRPDYARQLCRLLKDGSQLLTISYAYDQQQLAGPPFSVPRAEVEELFAASCAISLLHSESTLERHLKLKAAGVQELLEEVYLLQLGA